MLLNLKQQPKTPQLGHQRVLANPPSNPSPARLLSCLFPAQKSLQRMRLMLRYTGLAFVSSGQKFSSFSLSLKVVSKPEQNETEPKVASSRSALKVDTVMCG